MHVKSFDHVIPFTEAQGEGWLPIVNVAFILSNGDEYELPLLLYRGRRNNSSSRICGGLSTG
jgi:hypothetical protein